MLHQSLIRAFPALLAVFFLAGASLAAEEIDVDQVIDARQRNLRDMGAAFKAITDQLKQSSPNLLEISRYAGSLQEIAASQKRWFPPGTGPESGVKTAAKPEIWARPAEFEKWEDDLTAALALLAKATSGHDVGEMRLRHESVGKVCAGCHKTFRVKDD